MTPISELESLAALALEPLDERVDRLDVMILETAPQGIGEQFLAQAAIEIARCRA